MKIQGQADTVVINRTFRLMLLGTAGTIALCAAAQPAFASTEEDTAVAAEAAPVVPAPAADAAEDAVEQGAEILVTGTRIVRDGYSAPTPVSVISTEEINREAPANISDFVNTLPSVRGSGTSSNSNGALSNGGAGINTVNLRNLGANRTLVLVDGQRSVPSTNTGSVDVNTIPQDLIERVEVVTGGASSAYGSDAVSGVVNFILNKKFTGLRVEYEHGVTTYGDGPNHKFSATAGTSFADGKGHITLSGEYFTQKGIHSIDRDWNTTGFFRVNSPFYITTAGGNCAKPTGYVAGTPIAGCSPEFLVTSGAGVSGFAPGGLVTSGPLRGTYFGSINSVTGFASVNKLNYGAVGGQWMIGGDEAILSASHTGSATLLPSEKRHSAFGRISYEISPAFKVFAQAAYSRYRGQSFYQQTATTGLTIRNDNAFLPPEIKAAMAAASPVLTTLTIGAGNVFTAPQGSDNTREVYRFVVGADGSFDALGHTWNWDAYYQRGTTKTNELLTNGWLLQRYTDAIDAVVVTTANRGTSGLALGSIVCRTSLTAPTNGCVPLDVIGVNTNQPAAVNYITAGGLNPLRNQRLTQDVAAISFSTNNLFELPAGPVSLAFGGEWRKETISGAVDPLFQPGRDVNNNLVPTWLYGNFLVNSGKYDVKEGYIETVVPIISGMDFNGAFRLTDYSSSGRVSTWKTGLTWQVIDDVKLRATMSRDIRAPNLADLFAPGGGASNSVTHAITGGTGTVTDRLITSNIGNPNLKPEIAKTYGAGIVFTPTFLPGFAASVDYYNIKLAGAISTFGIQVIADQCYQQNITSQCNYILTSAGRGVISNNADIISIEVVPQNFVSIKTSGIDFEASYRREIGSGTLSLRGLASYAIEQRTANGVVADTNAAGQNTGNLPTWSYRFSAGYDFGTGFSFQAIARGVSGGVYDNNAIVCDTNCPASTADSRTMNLNKIPGAIYFDLNATYKFEIAGAKTELFLSVKNLLNTDPVLVANGPTGDNTEAYPQTNRNLYDVLGRVFRLGVRVKI